MKTRYYWIGAATILAASVYWKLSGSAPVTAGGAPPTVLVDTINLKPGSLPATVLAYGSIGAGAESTISTQASGVVATIAVVQGQRVAPGDPLLTITADAQSIADLHRAENALVAAKANHAHVAALLASHLATTADLAAADQVLGDANSTLAARRAAGSGKSRTVIAPFAGIVSAVLVSPGTLQSTGDGLLRMINTGFLVARVSVPPAQATAIRAGDLAMLTLLDTGVNIAGGVSEVSSILDPATGLTGVTLRLDEQAEPGAPVKAVINTGILRGFVVPRDAVQNDQQGDYVFQIDSGNIVHRVNVQVLGNFAAQTVLAPDLNTAMPMVTTGAFQLEDGAAVRLATDGSSH